jgi:hypothetical protein
VDSKWFTLSTASKRSALSMSTSIVRVDGSVGRMYVYRVTRRQTVVYTVLVQGCGIKD